MYSLTKDYRLTHVTERTKPLSGINASVYKIAGTYQRRNSVCKALLEQAQQIQDTVGSWHEKDTRSLRSALAEFASEFQRRSRGHETILPRALAAIAEAAFRTLGMRPFTVQIAGALGLYKGHIVEMATGEGKTLTAALSAVVRGWSRLPCHVITANDYLASRDTEKLTDFYDFCHVSAGSVTSAMQPLQRIKGYSCDVTYSTAKEVAADFLRDRLALGTLQKFDQRQIRLLFDENPSGIYNGVVTRGIHTAIIDEADSLLIDEAVTPLIISRNQENDYFSETCRAATTIASLLIEGKHYRINRLYKEIELFDNDEIATICQENKVPRRFSGAGFQRELLRQALTAREFFHKNKQYVIQDDKIVIVDEFTGRTMAQRTWNEGLHQMVEAKEKLPITPPNETLARLSFQRYFRFYRNLSGMTGTAQEASSEFWHIYGLPVIPVPPNRPCRRTILPRRFFSKKELKWDAIVQEILEIHATGRPILVGTRSVEASEFLAEKLTQKQLSCRIINAVRHREEAAIVAEAGKKNAITVATNMAGRGTDILLDSDVITSGGLHVIAAECNESARIDRQLFGRCARQGDPGTARSFVSMDDDLLKRYLSPTMLKVLTTLLNLNAPLNHNLLNATISQAQNIAQEKAFSSRKAVQKMDTWLQDSLSFAPGEF
jgi:preprotein translocase subunit SecA